MAIRVLLVEDAPVVMLVLKRMLASASDIQVVGTASHGIEALALIPQVLPDVICTDLNMPEMDGWALTREVMQRFPRPILVLSASVQQSDTDNVFRVLAAGAVDVLAKPVGEVDRDRAALERELLDKIRVLSGVSVFSRRGTTSRSPMIAQTASVEAEPVGVPVGVLPTGAAPVTASVSVAASIAPPGSSRGSSPGPSRCPSPHRVLAIGASTGGPQTLSAILSALPGNFPAPIVCTQHISHGFLAGLVHWLNAECALTVQIAQAGDRAQPGHVYFAPEANHLTIDRSGILRCVPGAQRDGHCPSVTAMFESVAIAYGRRSTGVLLTGMGRDGAAGLLAMANQGAMTIAQNESSCVVFGMPKEAIALHAAQLILPPPGIVAALQEQFAAADST